MHGYILLLFARWTLSSVPFAMVFLYISDRVPADNELQLNGYAQADDLQISKPICWEVSFFVLKKCL